MMYQSTIPLQNFRQYLRFLSDFIGCLVLDSTRNLIQPVAQSCHVIFHSDHSSQWSGGCIPLFTGRNFFCFSFAQKNIRSRTYAHKESGASSLSLFLRKSCEDPSKFPWHRKNCLLSSQSSCFR
jgi:hypothetical protein